VIILKKGFVDDGIGVLEDVRFMDVENRTRKRKYTQTSVVETLHPLDNIPWIATTPVL
jgi:hypothetical protein